jgi:HD-like signal output (HDOD) protein
LEVFCSVVVGVVATSVIYRVPGFEAEVARERDHAMEVATVASRLCRKFGREEWRSMTFLGGLLHDAGRVLVIRNLGLLKRRHPDVEVGPYLLERLMDELHVPLGLFYGLHRGLAKEVRDVIVHHHRPLQAPDMAREPITYVGIADCLSESRLPLGSEILNRSIVAQLELAEGDVKTQAMLQAATDTMRDLRSRP